MLDILIDVGASSIRIKRAVDGVLEQNAERIQASSREEFYGCVDHAVGNADPSGRIAGIAISLAGEYDYENEAVVACWANPYLVGNLRDDMKKRFNCEDVCIVNDGDAHALAYRDAYDRQGKEFGVAVNLSLGTAVGFGLLDRRGNLLHNCEGHNWEIGSWEFDVDAPDKHLYWALGSSGLQALEDQHGPPDCYIRYGQRLCRFLAHDLVQVFHPKFIGLSGGIVTGHQKEIKDGLDRECEMNGLCNQGQPLQGIQVDFLPEDDFAMRGLMRLLTEKRDWRNVWGLG